MDQAILAGVEPATRRQAAPAPPPAATGHAGCSSAAWPPRQAMELALAEADAALLKDPQTVELKFLRACLLQMLGRNADLQAAYLEVLAASPDHLGALLNLGRHFIATGQPGPATTLFTHAVAHHPQDAASLVHLGNALYQADQARSACGMFERALKIAPDDQIAHTGLAFALEKLGQRERARRHRHLGFKGRAIIPLPFRGARQPVPVLMLASGNGGNVPMERFLDDQVFQTTIILPEFHDPAAPLPDHRLVVNAVGDVDAVPDAVRAAGEFLRLSAAPVINPPAAVAQTGRCENWRSLGTIPGVQTPRAISLRREILYGEDAELELAAAGLEFPLLIRSPGFHTGEHFARVATRQELLQALPGLPGEELIAIEYLDTRSADGRFRKYRVMMIDGELYPLHLAVSNDWKVHYFTADMAGSSGHRAEDERFLADMPGTLGPAVMCALRRIQLRLGLDYGGIDFALAVAPAGLDPASREAGAKATGLVLFEANATMIVPRPGTGEQWEYRRGAVDRIDEAVRRLLLGRCAGTVHAGA